MSYVRELLPGLRAGLYGASYRFEPIRVDVRQRPGKSDHNPDGLLLPPHANYRHSRRMR